TRFKQRGCVGVQHLWWECVARACARGRAPGVLSNRRTELALTDKLGTVVTSVDASEGSVLDTYSPNPFGASDETPPGFGFTSHREEQELGLIDMRARLYDPAIGRFLSP